MNSQIPVPQAYLIYACSAVNDTFTFLIGDQMLDSHSCSIHAMDKENKDTGTY